MIKKSIFLAIITFGFTAPSLLAEQTTMCFKQNHESLITIENTNLDGGECAGIKSANSMKNDGWTINDIKMTPNKSGVGTDFVYIFKKESSSSASISASEEELMAKLQARLQDEKKQEVEQQKQDIILKNSQAGEKFYVKHCATCHGEKGETNTTGASRPIKDLDHNEFKTAIRDYVLGNKDGMSAMLMGQYANIMDSNDIRNVYTYLKFINQKK